MRTSRCSKLARARSGDRERRPAWRRPSAPAHPPVARRPRTSAGGIPRRTLSRRSRKRSSLRQAMERSPTMRPAGLSIGASAEPPGPGYAAGKDPVEPGARAAPGDFVLAVVGGLVEPDAGTHRLALGAHAPGRPPSDGRSASRSAPSPAVQTTAHARGRSSRPSPHRPPSAGRRSASAAPDAPPAVPRSGRRDGSGARSSPAP